MPDEAMDAVAGVSPEKLHVQRTDAIEQELRAAAARAHLALHTPAKRQAAKHDDLPHNKKSVLQLLHNAVVHSSFGDASERAEVAECF
jgi:tetrahydrodipicolinate N-succinyltransferase